MQQFFLMFNAYSIFQTQGSASIISIYEPIDFDALDLGMDPETSDLLAYLGVRTLRTAKSRRPLFYHALKINLCIF